MISRLRISHTKAKKGHTFLFLSLQLKLWYYCGNLLAITHIFLNCATFKKCVSNIMRLPYWFSNTDDHHQAITGRNEDFLVFSESESQQPGMFHCCVFAVNANASKFSTSMVKVSVYSNPSGALDWESTNSYWSNIPLLAVMRLLRINIKVIISHWWYQPWNTISG